MVASHAMAMQSVETKANCTRVRVAGMLKALRIDFEEVLVKADDMYHAMQSICTSISMEASNR